jgi:hypothetical protein
MPLARERKHFHQVHPLSPLILKPLLNMAHKKATYLWLKYQKVQKEEAEIKLSSKPAIAQTLLWVHNIRRVKLNLSWSCMLSKSPSRMYNNKIKVRAKSVNSLRWRLIQLDVSLILTMIRIFDCSKGWFVEDLGYLKDSNSTISWGTWFRILKSA